MNERDFQTFRRNYNTALSTVQALIDAINAQTTTIAELKAGVAELNTAQAIKAATELQAAHIRHEREVRGVAPLQPRHF